MSSLSKEQLEELWELIGTRRAEFSVRGSPQFMFAPLTHGEVRMIYDAIKEWEGEDGDASDYAMSYAMRYHEGYLSGYEKGRESMRAELGRQEHAGEWVGPQEQGQWLVPSPSFIIDQDQLRADIRELGKAYPSLEDEPNGEDIYAGVHPVAGGHQDLADMIADGTLLGDAPEPPPVIEPLPEPVAIPIVAEVPTPAPTNGNGHHATPSPAAVATLGPEHTVVTPLGTRRSGALSEVDEAALSRTRMSKDELSADLRMTIHALQDMAVDGEMPSMNDWLLNRPAGMMTAQGIQKRHNLVWSELAEYAKLKLKGKRGGRQ